MPTSEQLIQVGKSIVHEIDHFGRGAPFVAYANVAGPEEYQHVFICRCEAHPTRNESSQLVQYVRYRMPLGRIAEAKPGEVAVVRIPWHAGPRLIPGKFDEVRYTVQAKSMFRLRLIQDILDATENQFFFPDGIAYVQALRRWIASTEAEIATEAAKPRRRRLAERFELADTPVVDTAQGEIWRLPIDRFLVINGAPGTGKTTTLIKRIAQKTDSTALIECGEVSGIQIDVLKEWLSGPKGWVLFTPSDLLRNYLQQALAQEGLLATEDQVPVWATSRIRIARDSLRCIGPGRFFGYMDGLLKPQSSESLSAWVLRFRDHFFERVANEMERTIAESLKSTEEGIANLERIEEERKTHVQREILGIIDELNGLGRSSRTIRLPLAIKAALQIRERLRLLLEKHKEDQWPEIERGNLKTLLEAAKGALDQITDTVEDSVDSVLRKIPFVYHEYRLQASEGGLHFYKADRIGAVNDRKIDPLELDGLLYVALSVIRDAFGRETVARRRADNISDRMRSELRYFVAVDEATDFSAVELTCMRLLANPVFGSTTFSGDLMQRMTGHGISKWSQVGDLGDTPEVHELRFSYRQTKKLLGIAAKLYERSIGEPAPFEAGFAGAPDDPDALHFRSSSLGDTAEWLIQRIGEIYKLCGQLLPSIAIFVPDEDHVKELASRIRQPLLEAFGIDTEACLEGRILGTQAKVRVFSVQFIKGLEFEAVFFVAADRMAGLAPGLLERFLYVGLTRARSFLGVTTDAGLPSELEHIAECLTRDSWTNLLEPSV